jgi:hypothetical protein
MPSTYSPSLRIELIGEGEQDGIWGQTTNNNLGALIEQAITGITTVDVTAGNVTLTSFNGTVDQARSAVLIVNGSNTVDRNVVIPDELKTYIVTNNTNKNVGIKTTTGTAYLCTSGTQTIVYCNGSNVVSGSERIFAKGPTGVTSFTGTTFLGAIVAGSTSATQYSGIDFGSTVSTTPVARIAAIPGASGSLLQFGTTNNYTNGITNTAMTINTIGDVGIGVTVPQARLDVRDTGSDVQFRVANTGTVASDDSYILISTSSTGVTDTTSGLLFSDGDNNNKGQLRYSHLSDSMAFITNSDERMRISSAGFVGINTATPAATLDIFEDSSNTALRITQTGAGNAFLVEDSASTDSTPFVIDDVGNVGIGTVTPGYTLDIQDTGADVLVQVKNTATAAGDDAIIQILTNSTGTTATYSGLNFGNADNNNDGQLRYNHADNSMAFYTNAAESMRITGTGKFYVGTTSSFYVTKAIINWNSSTEQGITLKTTSTTFNGSPILFTNNVDGVSGGVSQTQTTVSYNTSSDYRLKENVLPMTGALAKIAALKPVTYTWKVNGSAGQGFIAHELQEIVPDCVTGAKDAVDENGNIRPQGVDTSFLVATLTAAIQEQQAIISAMEARLAALEA